MHLFITFVAETLIEGLPHKALRPHPYGRKASCIYSSLSLPDTQDARKYKGLALRTLLPPLSLPQTLTGIVEGSLEGFSTSLQEDEALLRDHSNCTGLLRGVCLWVCLWVRVLLVCVCCDSRCGMRVTFCK